jgi:hypothetical protein
VLEAVPERECASIEVQASANLDRCTMSAAALATFTSLSTVLPWLRSRQ